MRIVRFNAVTEPVSRARTGVLLGEDVIGDLRAGLAACLVEDERDLHGREIAALRIPADVRLILHAGLPARRALEQAAAWLARRHAQNPQAKGVDGESLFVALAGARLHNPLKPGRIVVTEGNAAGGRVVVRERPPASVMGPVRDLPLPRTASGLSYGTGLAVVIARACHGIDAREAPGVIAGYMVANDVSAPPGEGALSGDVAFRRCIIGPSLVDPADVADIRALQMTTHVNGRLVQSGTTAALQRSVEQLVADLSVDGLEAGDTIVTGLLSDGAPCGSGGAPMLQEGDLLESRIEGLGVLRNRVVRA